MRNAIIITLSCLLIASCSRRNNAIKVKGSDTEVNVSVELAEAFYSQNKDYSLAISGGGSGLGIASLFNGQADIANSSRPLKDEEIALFRKQNVKIITNIFAEDATAMIVHESNPLDAIDAISLGKILSGEINNWKDINGKDMPINIYGRQSNSGTHSFIQKKLNIKFSNRAKEMNGNAQIMEGIKSDPSGIGYVGAGYLGDGASMMKVKALAIRGEKDTVAISPLDHVAIQNKQYYFQRPLYQFIPATSYDKVKDFLEFQRSAQGKALILKSGYFDYHE